MKHKYSFVSEGDDHYVVSHPKDGEFKVAKKGISKSLHKKIAALPKALADGGEVSEDYPTETVTPQEQQEPSNPFFNFGMAKNAGKEIYGLGKEAVTEGADYLNKQTYGVPEQKPAGNPDIHNAAYAKDHSLDGIKSVPAPEEVPSIVPQPGEVNKEIPSAATTQQPTYSNEQIQANQQKQQPGSNLATVEDLMRKQAAIDQKAQAQIADTIKEQQLVNEAQLDNFNENKKILDAKTAQLEKDVADKKIDGNSVWNNMGTGGKMLAGIGMLLSGFGSGMAGGPNQAMRVLEDAQTRDLEAQKADLGKKENLLTQNYRKYGNLEMAYKETAIQQNAALTAQLQVIAATASSQKARYNAEQGIAMLRMNAEQQKQALAGDIFMKQVEAGDAKILNNQVPYLKNEEMKKRHVVIPGTNVAYFTRTEDAAKKVSEATQSAQELDGLLQRVETFKKANGTTMPGSSANKEADRLTKELREKYVQFIHLGREAIPEQKKELADTIPDIGSIRQENVDNSLKDIRKAGREKLHSFYQAYVPAYAAPTYKRAEQEAQVK